MTTTTFTPQDVPLPAGAVRVCEWDPPEVTGEPEGTRYFVGTSRRVDVDRGEHIEVTVDGMQWSDGRIQRYITVNQMHPDYPINGEQARVIGAVLIEAADEFDRLAQR